MAYEIFSGDQTESLGSSKLIDMAFWAGPARIGAGGGPQGLRDGDFDVAKPIEAPRPSYPFEEQGDKTTVMFRQRWRQAIEKIQAQPPYTTHPDKGDAYLIGEGEVDDKGQGIGVWERTYCTLPVTRTEYEKFPFAYQYLASESSLGTIVRSVTSQLKYEYFLARDRNAFKPLQKLQMDVLRLSATNYFFYKSGLGNLTLAPPTTFFVSSDELIVAEDSDVKTWKYPFMYRVTRYVPGPTLAFLGQSTSLPFPG